MKKQHYVSKKSHVMILVGYDCRIIHRELAFKRYCKDHLVIRLHVEKTST